MVSWDGCGVGPLLLKNENDMILSTGQQQVKKVIKVQSIQFKPIPLAVVQIPKLGKPIMELHHLDFKSKISPIHLAELQLVAFIA